MSRNPSYKGSIMAISGLIPANNDYPLIDAFDVQAGPNGERLDEVLDNIEEHMGPGFEIEELPGIEIPDMNDLNNKASKVRIDYYGNNVFKMGDKALNFEDIYKYHMVKPDFTFIVYSNRAYLCSFVNFPTTGMKEMRFESVINSDNRTKVSSIYIVSNDGVTIANTTVTDVNSENSSNKVNAITDANKASTTYYPSIKAVVDYIASVMGGST